MKDVLTGRADLLWALHTGGIELQEALAHVLGLERIAPIEPPAAPPRGQEPTPATGMAESIPPPAPAAVEVPFWYADSYVARKPLAAAEESTRAEQVGPQAPQPVREPVPFAPLASRAALLTRLRRVSAFWDSGGELDVDRIVNRLSRGEWLRRLPRRPRKRWGQSIQVIVDRSRRLIPYWMDQDLAVHDVERVYPRSRFQLAILPEGESEPRICLQPDGFGPYALPEPGAHVLVLGDLGCLARDQGATAQWWLEWGQRLGASGNQPLALVPCLPDRCPAPLTEVWTILPWESSGGPSAPVLSTGETEQMIRRVLALLCFALRVEPQLLRAVRRMQPECRWDPAIESLAWQDDAFAGRFCDAAAFDPEKARELRALFSQFDPGERKTAVELVAALHQDTYEGVWYSELLGLEHEVASGLVSPVEHRQAVEWFGAQGEWLEARRAELDLAGPQAAWHRRASAVLPASAFSGAAAGALHKIFSLVHSPDETGQLPSHLDPALLPPTGPERTIVLTQVANLLCARPFEPGEILGSPLALIRTRNGKFKIEPPADERDDAFWEGGARPEWAKEWGSDESGAWATFEVGGVSQRMLRIPPGKFLMGSPEEEQGRYPDEGPQHEVEVKRGFWMFETPCTQALWEAVMGENPSDFRGPDRPVETVSWNDVQSFLSRVAALVPGLDLKLPSEAHWEYACRAGTTGARYADDLAEIAWYYGNSRGATHAVGGKRPNSWGLHDMLGNVWEWCADTYREYGTSKAASAHRVVRGGAWLIDPRCVRAAYRASTSRRTGSSTWAFAVPSSAARVQRSGWSERRVGRSEGRSPAETTSREAEPGGWAWARAERLGSRFRSWFRFASFPTWMS
jgi:formylglycine-generating enzyme required for sulfatase activity